MIDKNVLYVLHGGRVTSRSDGDVHYISAQQLAYCYRLPKDSWVSKDNYNSRTSHNGNKMVIHLYPREDGNYTLPRLEVMPLKGTVTRSEKPLILSENVQVNFSQAVPVSLPEQVVGRALRDALDEQVFININRLGGVADTQTAINMKMNEIEYINKRIALMKREREVLKFDIHKLADDL